MGSHWTARTLYMICHGQDEKEVIEYLWRIPPQCRFQCITAAPTKGDMTTFEVAVTQGMMGAVKIMLVMAGTDIITDDTLCYAIAFDQPKVAAFLMSLGVDVEGSGDNNPLRAAINRNLYSTTKLLLQAGAIPTKALNQAIVNKDIRYLMLLLAYGADTSYATIMDVMHATTYSHIKLLMAFGATPLIKAFSSDFCRIYGDPCAWLLISAGISVPEHYYERFVRPSLYETAKTQFRFARIRKEVRRLRS